MTLKKKDSPFCLLKQAETDQENKQPSGLKITIRPLLRLQFLINYSIN